MPNDTLTMNYDMGSPTTFIITYLGKETIDGYQGMYYPKVVKGKGKGMIDDISQYELKEIIEDIDKKGYSDYEYTVGYEREEPYEYKEYNLRNDNEMLKGLILEIKDGYEITES